MLFANLYPMQFKLKRSFPLLDSLRGLAVLFMIIFHTSYHLDSYKLVSINFFVPGFWYYFPRLIVFLFLLCVGLSLGLTHLPNPNFPRFIKRQRNLALAALTISLVTYLVYPNQWVYFGTLHCIFFASLCGLLLIRVHRSCLVITFILFLLGHFYQLDLFPIKLLFPHASLDYIPLIPWIVVVFLGITLSQMEHIKAWLKIDNSTLFPLEFLGQHSLFIYLTHHFLILGSLELYTHII